MRPGGTLVANWAPDGRGPRLGRKFIGNRFSALQLALFALPWPIRRFFLRHLLGLHIGDGARVGCSLILAEITKLGKNARIGHLTIAKNLELFEVGDEAIVGNGNWISGYPRSGPSYRDAAHRWPAFRLLAHAATTHRHIIDCTNLVTIKEFATAAGYGTQILTHGIDLVSCRQRSAPVTVGRYTMLGTCCLLLNGAVLPDHTCLAAGSVLSRPLPDGYTLYAGAPARAVRKLEDCAYFIREVGFVL
jgi:acetyltransferase-like isoleucine patch superfamily enzyme